ncbi:MAG: phytanoyl-CoA dioxygenase family protein [Gammaproteobacteria bacterium]|jgi:phytanoyl-CoA hydroxylase
MFNFEITEEQIQAFNEDGFVVVDRIISDENVALLRERLDVLFSGEYETGIGPDEVNWKKERDPIENTRQICNGWKSDRYVASVVLRQDIGKACAVLGGWPGTRISQDNILWKPPGGKPLGFHQDSAYEQWTAIPEWASCWIALDDTTAEGGTVEYVRGSHRWGESGMIEEFHAPSNPVKELAEAASNAGVEKPERVPVVVKAGGGAFHQGWTWHGSDINHTQRPRRSVVAHCMSSENQFHDDRVSSIYSRYKRFGDNGMDESFFPVTWRVDGYRSSFIQSYVERKIGWGQ